MSYTPTTWTTGDTITATAMNKIENGIANAGGGGGYDAMIKMIHGMHSGDDSTWSRFDSIEIVSGDFQTLYNILSSGGVPRIGIIYTNPSSGVKYKGFDSEIVYFNDNIIVFIPYAIFIVNNAEVRKLSFEITWMSDDELTD